MRTRRRGMGMLVVVVFMGIVSTILALSMKALVINNRIHRVTETWNILEQVRLASWNSAAAATYPVFRQRVGSTPGRLSQLIGPIDSNDATNYPDICGFSYNNTQRNTSREWEPFLTRTFDPNVGLSTPMGTILNDFSDTTIAGTVYLRAVINGADVNDIDMIDELFDANNGAAAGTIRWLNISGGTARFTYMITADLAC